jgi:Na+/proline symporter
MSSADSQMLTALSAICEDVICKVFKIKDESGKITMLIAR